jgi:hypothetical protein
MWRDWPLNAGGEGWWTIPSSEDKFSFLMSRSHEL